MSVVVSHVFRRRHDVGGGLVVGRLVAGLAVQAAGEAAETVDVGPPGVVRYPPGLGVERVLLVDVVVLSVPGGRAGEQEGDGGAELTRGGRRKCTGRHFAAERVERRSGIRLRAEALTCCPLASRGGRRRTA